MKIDSSKALHIVIHFFPPLPLFNCIQSSFLPNPFHETSLYLYIKSQFTWLFKENSSFIFFQNILGILSRVSFYLHVNWNGNLYNFLFQCFLCAKDHARRRMQRIITANVYIMLIMCRALFKGLCSCYSLNPQNNALSFHFVFRGTGAVKLSNSWGSVSFIGWLWTEAEWLKGKRHSPSAFKHSQWEASKEKEQMISFRP